MRKTLNMSFIYFILAMAGGVFYREITKIMGFTGRTVLADVHVHLLMLGMMLFLVLSLFCKTMELAEEPKFKKFLILYNVGLPLMVIMLIVRGVTQVLELEVSAAGNGMISGFAGIAHIVLLIAFIFLFGALKKVAVEQK